MRRSSGTAGRWRAAPGRCAAFHERFYDPSIRDVQLDKTLIAASGDWIAVEWIASWENPDGSKGRQVAGEHWKMRGDRLCEWRAFVSTKRVG